MHDSLKSTLSVTYYSMYLKNKITFLFRVTYLKNGSDSQIAFLSYIRKLLNYGDMVICKK